MQKRLIIILTIIAVIMTFVLSEILSIYHFLTKPTPLTTMYLISILLMLEYLFLTITYVISKLLKKEKIKPKKILGLILLFVAVLLILLYVVVLNFDWLTFYIYSSPFYLKVIGRTIEFLIPAILLIIVSIKLLKGKKK